MEYIVSDKKWVTQSGYIWKKKTDNEPIHKTATILFLGKNDNINNYEEVLITDYYAEE